MRKGRWSLGVFLLNNYGLILVLLIVRTLMKHCQKLSKQAPYEIIKKSLRGWATRLVDGPKISHGSIYEGLALEIAEGIQMFKPKTLKEAITLAKMKDDQLSRHKKTVSKFLAK